MSKDRWIHLYYYISLTLIVICGSILYFFRYIDGVYYNPPLTFDSSLVTPDKTEYKPGDMIYVNWRYCKHRPLTAKMNVTLSDDIIITLPEFTRNAPLGCFEKSVLVVKIPDVVHTGIFTIEGVITYEVNPMKTVVYNLKSTQFKIVK